MNPRDLHRLASLLCSQAHAGPAASRTAISRCYYAAFHVAAEFLRGRKMPVPRNAGGHREALLRLMSLPEPDIRLAAALIGDLQTKRIEADYDMSHVGVERIDTARRCVESALTVIGLLDGKCRCDELAGAHALMDRAPLSRRRTSSS
ncbi:MAG: hypothetical protein HYZ53_29200 [Planctomycetes bacterium]|nr:hypothetical protein [Planctomycetota bacterium]